MVVVKRGRGYAMAGTELMATVQAALAEFGYFQRRRRPRSSSGRCTSRAETAASSRPSGSASASAPKDSPVRSSICRTRVSCYPNAGTPDGFGGFLGDKDHTTAVLGEFFDATEPARLTHDHWQPLLEGKP